MIHKLRDIIKLISKGSFSKYYLGDTSNNYDGKRFFNQQDLKHTNFFDFLKWRLTAKPNPWPPSVTNEYDDIPPEKIEGTELRVSWIGHVTFLLQTHNLNILTDPVWSERASPFNWAGPKRVHAPGIKFENLPNIDLVLISHNHYDHLDLETVKKLWYKNKPRIITPLGNDKIIHSYDPNIKVESYDWDDRIKINNEVEVTLESVHHWSARSLFDKNKALWSAFVLRTPSGNTCFLGDTAYADGNCFHQLLNKHTNFRLALIPIGAFAPRWFMQNHHMDPKEAILVYKHLNSPYSIPMHHLTFQLADDGYDEALLNLIEHAKEHKVNLTRFRPLKIGEHWYIPEN